MPSEDLLPDRLRRLRTREFGTSVTQKVLGAALKVSPPTISSWETGAAVPPSDRIADYARFFASPRSVTQERLLDDGELSAEERTARVALHDELRALRPDEPESPAPANGHLDFWSFDDGAPVRIICGQRDEEDMPAEARGTHRNFMALSAYADLDSLVELFGHVRSRNPDSDVRFVRPGLLRDDDLHTHIVLLGNMARDQASIDSWFPVALPVRQVKRPDVDRGEVFLAEDGESTRNFGPVPNPRGSTPDAVTPEFVEDVGFLARMPSPTNPDRTLTICSGIFTRGVHAAVRCMTDRRVAAANEAYLRSRFAGEPTFGVLMRVLIAGELASTPRLDDERSRLFEFP